MSSEFPKKYDISHHLYTADALIEIASELAPGENIVFHIKSEKDDTHRSIYYRWDLVEFEHKPSMSKTIPRSLRHKFMPSYKAYMVKVRGVNSYGTVIVNPFYSSDSSI